MAGNIKKEAHALVPAYEMGLRKKEIVRSTVLRLHLRNLQKGSSLLVKRMHVEELSNEKEWEKFVCSSNAGTFYHSLKWKEVIEKSFPHRAMYLVVRDSDGRIVGVLPGFIIKSLYTKIYSSTPHSDYGGPIIEAPDASPACFAILDFLRQFSPSHGLAYARFRMINRELTGHLMSREGHAESNVGVMEINLNAKPSQFIWKHVFSRNRRKKFKKIERRGFQVSEARTRSDLRVFYDLYLENMAYIGARPYPYSFMENIWDTLFPSFIRIRILENKKPVAAILCFRFAQKSFAAYAGIDRAEQLAYPLGNYLIWTEIKKAEEEGLTQLSLGSTPGDPNNLYFVQKSSMGSEFNKQRIIWHPLSPSGRALIQMRSVVVPAWQTVRWAFPRSLERTLQDRLSSL